MAVVTNFCLRLFYTHFLFTPALTRILNISLRRCYPATPSHSPAVPPLLCLAVLSKLSCFSKASSSSAGELSVHLLHYGKLEDSLWTLSAAYAWSERDAGLEFDGN